MDSDALTFIAIMVGVVLGTAAVLVGEANHNELVLFGGGVLVLLSVGGLTGAIART